MGADQGGRAAELIKALRSTDGTTDVSVIFRRIRQAADELETLCAEIEKLRRMAGQGVEQGR
jgi:riboflavin synthase